MFNFSFFLFYFNLILGLILILIILNLGKGCNMMSHIIVIYITVMSYIITLSRSLVMDFILFSLFTLFYFSFLFPFNFLFLEQLGLGFISHAVTSVTSWWRNHKTDHRTWKKKVEGFGTKWHYTAGTTHVGLMLYSWSFRVGCTVASTDHG